MPESIYPEWVCNECGVLANALTCVVKRGTLPNKPAFDVSTWHSAMCDVCWRETYVTEPRDFFYPEFSLLSPKFRKEMKRRHGPVTKS